MISIFGNPIKEAAGYFLSKCIFLSIRKDLKRPLELLLNAIRCEESKNPFTQ